MAKFDALNARELLDARNTLESDHRDPDGRVFLHMARRLLATYDKATRHLARMMDAQIAEADVVERAWAKKELELRDALAASEARAESYKRAIEMNAKTAFAKGYQRGTIDAGSNTGREDRRALELIVQLLEHGHCSTVSANRSLDIARQRLGR